MHKIPLSGHQVHPEGCGEALQKCYSRYATVAAGIIVQDVNGVIIEVNKPACEILDTTSEDLLGHKLANEFGDLVRTDGSAYSDDDNPTTITLRAAKSINGEVIGVTVGQNDERRWLMFNAEPIIDPDTGALDEVISTFWDITARKMAEERFRGLLESAPDAMVIVDSTGTIVLVNSQTEKVFGYSRDELVGKKVETLVPDRFRERHVGHRSGYTAEPRTRPMGVGMFLAGKRKDGSEFPVEISLSPMYSQHGLLVTSIIRDITDRKEAEESINQLNDELKRGSLLLEAANKELEAFAYSVSHDLRAPLRSIDGFSQALIEDYEDKLDEDGKNYLRRVRAASQKMAQLIDDLLKLSRVSRTEMRCESVDLSAMAEAISAELQRSQPERRGEFIIHSGLVVEGDSHLLQIAMQNLLDNAWKFTQGRDMVRIEFGCSGVNEDGDMTYYIRDNGAGFDMAYSDKLFGAFQRLHSGTEFPGTGIGLATVQRVIHRHGGHVRAEGEVDKGATFYFTLPPRHCGNGS